MDRKNDITVYKNKLPEKSKAFKGAKKVVNKLFCMLNPDLKTILEEQENFKGSQLDIQKNIFTDSNIDSRIKKIEASEERLFNTMVELFQKERFINNVPSAITVKDKAWRYVWVSDYLVSRMWLDLNEIVGKTDDEIDFFMATKRWEIITDIKDIWFWVVEYQIKLEKNKWKYQYILMREKQVDETSWDNQLIIWVWSDITKMIELQEITKMQQVNANEVFENLLCWVWYLNSDLYFQDVNPAFCKLYECTPQDFQGKPLSDFFHLSPDLPQLLEELRTHGNINNFEMNSKTLKWNKRVVMISAKILESNWRIFFSVLDITDLKETQEKIKEIAYIDHITELPNRFSIQNFIIDNLPNVKRYDEIIGLLFIDLDWFKAVNDTHGHSVWDSLLKLVWQRLKSVIRHTDKVSRIWWDEFLLCLRRVKETSDIDTIVNKVLKVLHSKFMVNGIECVIGWSVWITIADKNRFPNVTYNRDQETTNLIKEADKAMYEVKNTGKWSFMYYHDIWK